MPSIHRPTEDYLAHYFDIARYQWIFAFSIGVFCALFLLLRRLTRRRIVAWLVWTWLLIATVVFLYYNYLGDWHDFRWSSYFGFIRDIGLLLSFPMAGFIFYIRHESLKSEYVQLKSIQLQKPVSRLVHFSSANQKDQVSVALDDLVLLESQDNYVAVVYLDGEVRRSSLIRSSLKRLEETLDEPLLVRCHRSFMVNLARVRGCQGNQHGLKLTVDGAGRSVPVSRAYTGTILQKLGTSPGDV